MGDRSLAPGNGVPSVRRDSLPLQLAQPGACLTALAGPMPHAPVQNSSGDETQLRWVLAITWARGRVRRLWMSSIQRLAISGHSGTSGRMRG